MVDDSRTFVSWASRSANLLLSSFSSLLPFWINCLSSSDLSSADSRSTLILSYPAS